MTEKPSMSILWAEINSGKATRRSLAVAYAMVIGGHDFQPDPALGEAHDAMMRALKTDARGLDAVKKAGWAIFDGAVARRRDAERAVDRDRCPACQRIFVQGGTCSRGGCPMGGDF